MNDINVGDFVKAYDANGLIIHGYVTKLDGYFTVGYGWFGKPKKQKSIAVDCRGPVYRVEKAIIPPQFKEKTN